MNINGHEIQFEHPEFITWGWLSLVFVVAVCVFGYVNLVALRNRYASPKHLDRTTKPISTTSLVARTVAYTLLSLLLSVALAGPFLPDQPTTIPSGTINMVGAFDVSISMAAEDYRDSVPPPLEPDGTAAKPVGPWGSRLMMSKYVMTEQIMKSMTGNRVGLGTYSGEPWPQAPLCEDYGTLRFMLTDTDWIGIGKAPGEGSDWIKGLKLAVQTLQRDYDPKMRQIVVLFSDGGLPDFKDADVKADWEADLKAVVAELEALKAELLIVAVGSKTPQLVPIYHPRTWQRVDWFPFGAPENEKEKTALDEQSLQKLLALYPSAQLVWLDPQSPAVLDHDWVKTIGGTKTTLGKLSLAHYPLAAALALFALVMLRGFFRSSDQVPPRPTFPQHRS